MKILVKFILPVLLLLAGIAYGLLAGRYDLFPANLLKSSTHNNYGSLNVVPGSGLIRKDGGFWHLRRGFEVGERRKTLEQLRSLPYVTGSESPAEKTGVTVHERDRTAAGYNLYSSAHGPQAFIIDMDGRVLHQWEYDRDAVWPQLSRTDVHNARRYFRSVHVFENGDLLAIYEFTGIVRLDSESKLVWAHQGWNHHDLDVDHQDRIYVLGRDIDEMGRHSLQTKDRTQPPKVIAGRRVFDESITILSPGGDVIDKISIIECIENSAFAPLLDMVFYFPPQDPLDLLHPNTVDILDGTHASRSPAFRRGNILTSFRNLSTVAIIDPTAREVVWVLSGGWRYQHQPVLMENGMMLVFDNLAGGWFVPEGTQHSRVVEFDPLTQEVVWEFAGSEGAPFFSSLMGANQRLWNGNTLITESDYGRVIEVTPDKRIVWEFNNPHTAGDDDEFVATIPELTRLRPDFPLQNFASSARKSN